jgi:hypothetical protein
MVHRPIKVNADISSRNISANEARDAVNMRFGQVPGDNEQGFETRTGNALLQSCEFDNSNFVVGVCDLSDGSGVVYAIWNEDGNDAIFVYSTGYTGIIIQGNFLNFFQDQRDDLDDYLEDYSVSMQEINGILYFQDTQNPPRQLDWQKYIDGFYTSTLVQDWELSRIWRKPAYPFGINYNDFDTSPTNMRPSPDVSFPGVPSRANQWAYSYVRSDGAESRLSPYSPPVWAKDVDFYIPREEADAYLRIDNTTPNNLIRAVNFYFRVGNFGDWQLYQSVENVSGNYYTEFVGGAFQTIKVSIESQATVAGTAAAFDIGGAVADATPLIVRDSKLMQDRLFDAGITEGYEQWTSLQYNFIEQDTYNVDPEAGFHPECEYKIGVWLIDEWGRRNGVVNITNYQATAQFDPTTDKTYVAKFDDVADTFTDIDKNLGYRWGQLVFYGAVPTWCKSVEIGISQNKTMSSFFRTQGLLWQWALVDNQSNAFGAGWNTSQMALSGDPNKRGAYKGIAIELNSGEGFNFSGSDQVYARIIGVSVFGDQSSSYVSQINANLDLNDPSYATPFPVYFKVVGVQGGKVLCETTEEQFNMFGAAIGDPSGPAIEQPIPFARWYVEFFTQAINVADTFYTVATIPAEDIVGSTVNVYGDCYFKNQSRTYTGGNMTSVYNFDTANGNFDVVQYPVGNFTTTMYSISQSLLNPYSDFWDWNKGSPNIVNPLDGRKEYPNMIRPTGKVFLGTQTNFINQSLVADQVFMPTELGAINCLAVGYNGQISNSVLLAWCINGVASNYIGQAQFADSATNTLELQTTRIIGTTRVLQGSYGTERIKHVVSAKNGKVYALSPKWQDVIRYANDGLTRLGEVHNFYTVVRQIGDYNKVCIGYDPFYEEVILSGSGTNGLAHNDRYDLYQGRITMVDVERMWTLDQLNLISFQNGSLFIHSYENTGNLWFLDPQDSGLTLISNPEVNRIKRWNSVCVDGPLPESTTTTTDTGTIAIPSYIDRKGIYKAAIPGFSQGKILTTVFVIDASSKKTYNFVEILGTLATIQ